MQHPTIYWAQNKTVVYVRVAVMGATNVVADLQEEKIDFKCQAQGHEYGFVFPLAKKIDVAGSKYRVMGQGVEIIMKKSEEVKEFWQQINAGGKLPYVRIDWDRWIDEDDEEKPKAAIPNFDGMNFNGGMGDFQMPDMSNFKMPEGADDCGCGHEHCHEHQGEKCDCGDDCACHEHEHEAEKDDK